MNGRIMRSLFAFALTIAIALISVAALAQANYAFSPPVGWTNLRSGSSSKWINPTGSEFVILRPTAFAGDLSALVDRTLKQERATHPALHLWTNKDYRICGRREARYLIWTAHSNIQGKDLIWEELVALWGADAYVVTYQRPENHPPSAVARSSMLSICGVGSAPEQPGAVPVKMQTHPPAAPGQANPEPAATAPPTPYTYPTMRYAPVIP